MRALVFLLASVSVLSVTTLLAPVAAAEPCEVPGCNVVGAAICVANEVTDPAWNYKRTPETVSTCSTQTA